MQYSYPKNLSLPLPIDHYHSLGALLDQAERSFADRIALINFDSTLTFAQVAFYSNTLRDFLLGHCQIKKGDRVAVFMPNIMQFIIIANAALKAGATVVNINPLYTPAELQHVLLDAKPKVMFFVENFAKVLAEIDPAHHPEYLISTQLGDCFTFLKRTAFNFIVRYVKKMIPSYKPFHNVMTWHQAIALGKKSPQHIVLDLLPSDIAFLQYTGGTTGVAKGAMLTHRNMIANVLQASSWVSAYFEDASSYRIATPLPLYHIFALTANFFTFYILGAQNLLITNPRDLKSFIKDWKKYPVDAIAGVNTLFNALSLHPDFKELNHDRLKLTFGGGMAIQPSVAQRWHELTGKPIVQAYGLTEASPAVCINPLNQSEFNGSIGLPIPHTDVILSNEEGEAVAQGELGELWVKGPQVMKGYWNQPEETEAVLTSDGWLKTGDIGYQDEQGYVFIVDRKKDMIIISGFNVYPTEIESVIAKHESIKEIGVIGAIDANGVEIVQACCVIKEGYQFNPQALDVFCRQYLTAYKIPKVYLQLKELPKSNVGKILKKDLKKDITPYLI